MSADLHTIATVITVITPEGQKPTNGVESDSTQKPASAKLHPTAQQICDQHGISRRMYFHALKVRKEGCEELSAAVIDGAASMILALDLLAFDHSIQRLILAELPSIKPRQRAKFVELVRITRLQEIANA